MEDFIINKESVSVESIRNDLLNHIQSKPEFARFKDFYNSSAGKIIIDLIAGYAAFLVYKIVVGRRENTISHAENRSSNIGIAQNLSYSVFRGLNSRVSVLVTATQSPIILSKWDVIGEVSDLDLLVLNDEVINAGESRRITCTVGNILSETVNVDSDVKKPFRFKSNRVSEDIRLYQNNSELGFTREIKDLIEDRHVLISNTIGAVDLYYLNNNAPFYDTGDQFRIDYIQTNNLEFLGSDVQIELPEASNAIVESFFQDPEPTQEIKVNAPLYFETQYKIRGRNDFKKIFRTLETSIVDTNGKNFSPSVVELTYVRDNLTLFNQVEKENFLETLNSDLPWGSITSEMSNPIRTEIGLDIQINLSTSTSDNVSQRVREVLESYEKNLQVLVDKEEIEDKLNDLSYVKSVRVNDVLKIREENTFYTRIDYAVETLGCAEPKFEFLNHIRRSGTTEPSWPTEEGQTVWDGRVLWQARDERLCNLAEWESELNYRIGDKVKPEDTGTLIFVVIAKENLSGPNAPTWNEEIGDITYDHELIWQTVEFTGTPSNWENNKNYFTGDTVLPFSNAEYGLQVVGYRSRSGNSAPVYPSSPNIRFEDGDIEWISRDRENNLIRLLWNEYTIISENISIG